MARRDDRHTAGESSRDCVERWRPAGTIEIEISLSRARAFDERRFDDLQPMSPTPKKSVNISSVRARLVFFGWLYYSTTSSARYTRRRVDTAHRRPRGVIRRLFSPAFRLQRRTFDTYFNKKSHI